MASSGWGGGERMLVLSAFFLSLHFGVSSAPLTLSVGLPTRVNPD